MVAGVERYYQIVRCFRDEALRADRQPEFTQLDLEVSFLDEEDVYALGEELMAAVWRDVLGAELEVPFPAHPRRGHAPLRHRQARPALRHGAGRPRAGVPGHRGRGLRRALEANGSVLALRVEGAPT